LVLTPFDPLSELPGLLCSRRIAQLKPRSGNQPPTLTQYIIIIAAQTNRSQSQPFRSLEITHGITYCG
jgi:hypothetical protein